MEQIKELDAHKHWKHVKSGKLYTVMGFGLWAGGVNDHASDNDTVVAFKHTDNTDFEVVPEHYTVANVRSADIAIMQTTQPLSRDDKVVVYVGDYYGARDRVFVRRHADFFDGRFVKVDEKGNELPTAKPAKAAVVKDAKAE